MKKNCQEIHKYNETSGTGIKFQCFRLRFNLVCNNTNFLIEFLKSTSLQFAVENSKDFTFVSWEA